MVQPRNSDSRKPVDGRGSCVRCDRQDDDRMVKCKGCERAFHEECVLETELPVERLEWRCFECVPDPPLINVGEDETTVLPKPSTSNEDSARLVLENNRRFAAIVSDRFKLSTSAATNKDKEIESLLNIIESMRRENSESRLEISRLQNDSRLPNSIDLTGRRAEAGGVGSAAYIGTTRNQNSPILASVTPRPSRPENVRLTVPVSQDPAAALQDFKKQALASMSATLDNLIAERFPAMQQLSAPASCPTHSHDNPFETSFQEASGSASWDRVAVQMSRKYLQKLPTFNGEVRKWGYFEAVYNSTTLSGNYNEADNVCRLREALKPPASDLVESLLNFSTNATQIMNELRDSYGRPNQLMLALLDDLYKIPSMSSLTDPRLREFAIKVNNFVANVKALGQQQELASGITLEKLTQKLYVVHHLEWKRARADQSTLNIEDFGAFINRKVKEIPDGYLVKTSGESNPKKRRVNAHQQSSSGASSSGPKVCDTGCYKCGENHPLAKCSQYLELSVKDRWRFIFPAKICSACLAKRDHKWQECPSKRECGVQGCGKHHHRSLHSSTPPNNRQATNTAPTSNQTDNDSSLRPQSNSFVPRPSSAPQKENLAGPSKPCMSHSSPNSVLFKIVPIRIFGEDSFVNTFAFLDDGSSLTLLDREIFERLNLSGVKEKLSLQWTKGITRVEDSHCTTVVIGSAKGKQTQALTNVYVVNNLDLPAQTVDLKNLKERFHHLRGLPIPELNRAKPKILIGLQHTKLLLCGQNFAGGDDEPVASKTRLGWVVYGNASPSMGICSLSHIKTPGLRISFHDSTRNDAELHQLVKQYFTTENFGVMPPKRELISEENRRANEIMRRTLRFVEGRYEIGLLWKKDDIKLPDSYPMALNRLISLERSLKRKPELMSWKNKHVADLVTKGYARKATDEDLQSKWPRVWYCPTFIVVNENKIPPKPRDVADVAAQVRGVSLNTNLLKGPDNMAPLLGGLCKFRENFVPVTADVKEMFHQVAITQEDQQCQRFLWRDCDDARQPTVYIMRRMMFGPTCSPSCAQFVKNHHAEQFADKFPEAVDGICRRTYVDDYMNSHDSVATAVSTSKDAIEICASMGFDLRGFQSSHRELLAQLPEDKVKEDVVSFDRKDPEDLITKVLGLYWQPSSDHFTFRMTRNDLVDKMMRADYHPTKREVLKVLMKTFDPLGLIAHYLVRGKIVLQEIWREGVGWDESIPADLSAAWKEFLHELCNIERLEIPRHYAAVTPSQSYVELIVFVDASEKAFAATAYFRFTCAAKVYIAHVMAKAKVAPIKKMTIPQLELQAAVLGVRLASSIKKLHSFTIHESKFMSDSKVTLQWICSRKYNFKTFVAARVGEILESTTCREWYHVGSKDNVADDATKWSDPTMGDSATRWFSGPDFLQRPFEEWPIKSAVSFRQDEDDQQAALMLHQTVPPTTNKPLLAIEEIGARFKSRWTSLIRVIAFQRRYIAKVMKQDSSSELYVTPTEFRRAEEVVFKAIQCAAFPDELKSLAQSESVRRSSRLFKLSPIIVDGLIRLQSRAQKANVSYDVKNPIILPNKHELVDLFIFHVHERNFHMGEEMTIAEIRERAWVIDARSALRRIKRNCQLCKILRATPKMPRMGELPTPRIDFGVKPFTHTGLDAFGPYSVKFGRGTVKRYGLIFTCLTYRAVHIELLDDMTTDLCIMALRRFLVRRGGCSHLYSDNGKNFVGAKNVLHKDLNELKEDLGAECAQKFQLQWHFQPAYSPWWGGAWERLIQSIKKCIDFVMQSEKPHAHVLHNAIIEAEFWMNRRPLTHIPVDHEDAEPLTPYLALFGQKQEEVSAVLGTFAVNEPNSRSASKRAQHLVDKFMSRWVKEYLPNIMRRSKWFDETVAVKLGDIVIITDPSQPKIAWRKGRIVKIHPGKDQIIRAADVEIVTQVNKKLIKPNIAVGRIAVLDVKSSPPTEASDRPGFVA